MEGENLDEEGGGDTNFYFCRFLLFFHQNCFFGLRAATLAERWRELSIAARSISGLSGCYPVSRWEVMLSIHLPVFWFFYSFSW